MLLAIRRFFGFARPLGEGAEETAGAPQEWVIEPTRLGYLARFEEMWRFRRMLWFFSTRAVKDRYEATTLGAFWLFARPLMPIAINTVVFGSLLGVPSDGVPYLLFYLTTSSCWRVFERSMRWVARSLDQNKQLLKKVYFPRLAAPISSIAPAIAEFLILVALLLIVSVVYYFKDGVFYLRLGPQMLVAILAALLTIFFAIAIGLWTSVWQVRHKDVQYSIRYVMQFWSYATPVMYPMSYFPGKWRFLMYINPMAPLVEMYKWGMLGVGEFPTGPLISGTVIIAIVFGAGLVYFDRSEAGSIDKL
jgi:lipopolysaccharide transport system permease protein